MCTILVTVELICVLKVTYHLSSLFFFNTSICLLPLSSPFSLPFLSVILSHLLSLPSSLPSLLPLLSFLYSLRQAISPGYYISLIRSSQRSKSKFRRLLTGLMHNSGDVNTTGENGMTALHFAVLVSKKKEVNFIKRDIGKI